MTFQTNIVKRKNQKLRLYQTFISQPLCFFNTQFINCKDIIVEVIVLFSSFTVVLMFTDIILYSWAWRTWCLWWPWHSATHWWAESCGAAGLSASRRRGSWTPLSLRERWVSIWVSYLVILITETCKKPSSCPSTALEWSYTLGKTTAL